MSKKHAKRASALNLILSQLSTEDHGIIAPHLEPIELPLRMSLEQRQKKVKFVYFIDTGIVSVVANGDREVEIGIIGREGMTGLSVVHGAKHAAPYETYVQIAGTGRRIDAGALRTMIGKSQSMTGAMLLYAHTFLGQVTQTALANARGSLEQRLSRWLLMVNDRIEGDVVPLTHEFLSVMLAVRRPGVTLALQELERSGAISQRRGTIAILDRETLEDVAAHTYIKPGSH